MATASCGRRTDKRKVIIEFSLYLAASSPSSAA
jgi:hypothetical protein